MTTGDSWVNLSWQSDFAAPLADKVINPGSRSAHCPCLGVGKSLWSLRAVPSKLCHVVLRSGVPIGRRVYTGNAHSSRIASLIGSIGHPRFTVCACTVFLFPVADYVSSVNVLPPQRSAPCNLCANDVANVRSDKDSEPEAYGEGIKKEIQYRRTLYLKTIVFWNARCPGGLWVKIPISDSGKCGFRVNAKPLSRWRRLWQLADFPLDGL